MYIAFRCLANDFCFCRPKPENVHQNLFDGIFCYKLPTEILFKYMLYGMLSSICSFIQVYALGPCW